MKFETALLEIKKTEIITDYNHNKSYFRWKNQRTRILLTSYQYKKENKFGLKRILTDKFVPIYSSNEKHPVDQINKRFAFTEEKLESLLLKAMEKIKNMGFPLNGYIIEQTSTGIVIPTILYKNTDISKYTDGLKSVFQANGTFTQRGFEECPDYFLEVRTVLDKVLTPFGTDQIKIFSNPDVQTILPNPTKILLEEYQNFIWIKL